MQTTLITTERPELFATEQIAANTAGNSTSAPKSRIVRQLPRYSRLVANNSQCLEAAHSPQNQSQQHTSLQPRVDGSANFSPRGRAPRRINQLDFATADSGHFG
jgi:hypothetical protein